jgi:hypothetical protein
VKWFRLQLDEVFSTTVPSSPGNFYRGWTLEGLPTSFLSGGGDLLGLTGGKLIVAIAVSGVLGALMTIGKVPAAREARDAFQFGEKSGRSKHCAWFQGRSLVRQEQLPPLPLVTDRGSILI